MMPLNDKQSFLVLGQESPKGAGRGGAGGKAGTGGSPWGRENIHRAEGMRRMTELPFPRMMG